MSGTNVVIVVQTVENNVQTLSLGEWMQLPGLTFAEWRSNYAKCVAGVLLAVTERISVYLWWQFGLVDLCTSIKVTVCQVELALNK